MRRNSSAGILNALPNGVDRWTVRFTHKGKSYRLFKRRNSGNARYYFHVQAGKKRRKKSMDSCDPSIAEVRAKAFLDTLEAVEGERAKILLATTPLSLEGVFEVYRIIATIEPRTVKNNILAMLKIIEKVRGQKPDPTRLTLADITRQLATSFQDICVIAATEHLRPGTPEHREARERALRSSRSTICQARSIFSRSAHQDLMVRYDDYGVYIPPNVIEFVACKLRGKTKKADYRVPSDEVIRTTFKKIECHRKTDPSLYLAFWLAVGAGLRRKEIRHCRWEHIIDADGHTWISGGVGKDGVRIHVPVQERAAKAIRPFRKPEGFVIPERSDRWCKRLCAWMRELGWTTDKLIHELRAYSGSLIYRESPLAAMRFLRHKSIQVSERHYIRYAQQIDPVNVL